MRVESFLTGIHARSERLVDATRAYDKGELSAASLEEEFRRDAKDLLATERESGLSLLSDGLLKWQDLLRPITELTDGVKPGPYARWFETNTFYRKPVVDGELEYSGGITRFTHLGLVPRGSRALAVLPGPCTMALLSEDRYYRRADELMFAFADVLVAAAAELTKAGAELIVLSEPCLVYERAKKHLPEFSLVSEAVRTVCRGACSLAVHTYFGDASRNFEDLAELPAGWVGVDLTETDLKKIEGYSLRGIALGCVDATSPVVEKPEVALRPVRELLDASSFDAVALCTTTCLKYLPRPIADEKVRALGKLAAVLEEEV